MKSALLSLLRFALLYLLSFGVMSGNPSEALRYHGIIVGINEYDHWGDLRRARKDAEALATILKSKYSFDSVTCLFDEEANASGIEKTLREVIPSLTDQDALFLYFSGHGYYDSLLDQGFWIPSDARVEQNGQPVVRDWIENDRIKQYLERCEARHVLVVSDACFSGALFKGDFTELKPSTKSWYANAALQPSRWAITSGDMEVVPDASVFGMKLLQLLKFPPREVFSVSDLAGWLKKEVAAFEGTLPVAGPLHDPNHKMGGEFVFVENGIESEFWQETPVDSGKTIQKLKGSIHCYSNMDSQVYVNDDWVGFVDGGSSILIDEVEKGQQKLSVKSELGLFQKSIDVRAGETASVNAVFYASTGFEESGIGVFSDGVIHLNMDQEQDPRLVGLMDNNGVYVTRDAIRGNALRFQQRGNLSFRSTELNDFGRGDFFIGLWFKSLNAENETGLLLSKRHPTIGVAIHITDQYLGADLKSENVKYAGKGALRSKQKIIPEAWYYVVFQRKGEEATLWLNGELQDRVVLPEFLDYSYQGPLIFGYNDVNYDHYFTGLMDEVEILERAKTPEEINAAHQLKYEKFRITRKQYSEREDLDLIAKKLYGGGARVADWQEIISRFPDDLDVLWQHLGMEENEKMWVTYLNRRFFNSARHFYAFQTRDQVTDIDDEIHQQAETEEDTYILSSWVNMELPILIEL